MKKIVAEIHYYDRSEGSFFWQHRKIGEKAEITLQDIEEISQKHKKVTVTIKRVYERVFGITPIKRWPTPLKMPKTIIVVEGYDKEHVRHCLKDLLKLYGVPDNCAGGLFGEKKRGKKIVESLLQELLRFRTETLRT
ncbi:MAG: hypothetical protein QXG27_05765 [Candidatus Bathyarchaeia archaeon]